MDRDPSTTGAGRRSSLGGFPVLTAIHAVTTLVGLRSAAALVVSLPLTGNSLAKRLVAQVRRARVGRAARRMAQVAMAMALAMTLAMTLAAAYPATRPADVFPGLAIPGMLDGRSISGLGQRALSGLGMLILTALAVHLLRVTVSTARERPEPARAEVAG